MQTTTIDTRPDQVNVTALGGDTLTISVTAPETIVAGMEWSAQVRASKEQTGVPLATFDITEPTEANGPAYLTLPAAVTTALIGTGAVTMMRTKEGSVRAIQQFSGVWDCQISGASGADPVTTLVQGTLTLEMDVTRA